jgi:hypothetical protein
LVNKKSKSKMIMCFANPRLVLLFCNIVIGLYVSFLSRINADIR